MTNISCTCYIKLVPKLTNCWNQSTTWETNEIVAIQWLIKTYRCLETLWFVMFCLVTRGQATMTNISCTRNIKRVPKLNNWWLKLVPNLTNCWNQSTAEETNEIVTIQWLIKRCRCLETLCLPPNYQRCQSESKWIRRCPFTIHIENHRISRWCTNFGTIK